MRLKELFIAAYCGLFPWTASADQLIVNNAPFKSQSPPGDWNRNMNCGPAAAMMLAGYYLNFAPTAEDLMRLVDWMYDNDLISPQAGAEYYDGNVTNIVDLQTMLTEYFGLYPAVLSRQSDISALNDELRNGNPVIVGVNVQMDPARLGHFMVVVGMENNTVIVHDPGRIEGSFIRYDVNQFLNSWQSSNFASLVLNPSTVVWHPDGALLQNVQDERIYIVIDGALAEIIDGVAFASHNFDRRRVIPVSPREIACYPRAGDIDWRPYRELFQIEDSIFMMERSSFMSPNCAFYQFASETSFNSWTLNGNIRRMGIESADREYFSKCGNGGILYLRAGTLVKPNFQLADYGQGVVFVATGSGVLRPFANWETFSKMGYDGQPIMLVGELQFAGSFAGYSEMIDMETAAQCLAGNFDLPLQGGGDDDLDEDGYSVFDGDCNDLNDSIAPGKLDVCDGIDNNCDGLTDEWLGRDCESACGAGRQRCFNGVWSMCEIVDFYEEIEDGADNDCDGEIDEGFEIQAVPDIDSEIAEENNQEAMDAGLGEPPDSGNNQPMPDDPEDVVCTISCPEYMRAYAWYGASGEVRGQPAVIETTRDQICERGGDWIDFNCACTAPREWSCFDWQVAEIECNHPFDAKEGIIDYVGEGEIWFTDFNCL